MTTPPTKQVTTRDGEILIVARDWAPDFPWHRVFKSRHENTWLIAVNNRPTTLGRALYGITDPNIQVRRRDTSASDFSPGNCYLQHRKTLKILPWKPGTPLLPEPKDILFRKHAEELEAAMVLATPTRPTASDIPEFIDLTGTGFIVNTKHALGLIDVRDPQIVSVDLLIPDRPLEGRPMSFAFEGEQADSIRKWAHYLTQHQAVGVVTGPTQQDVDILQTEIARLRDTVAGCIQDSRTYESQYTRLIEKLKEIGFANPERLLAE